jgi:alkaline phosphatase
VNSDAAVVMGGGWLYFLPPERGKRPDGDDLTVEAQSNGFEVVYDKESLEDFDGERLLGLFAPDDLPFESARPRGEVPSLSRMMDTALEVLSADPDGFLLVIEGGRIDHAEHDNMISEAIGDFLGFDAAIGRAMEYQDEDPALTIIISADHDCGGPAITAGDYGYPSYEELDSLVREDCAIVGWVSGDHTGTMVPVFARGPGAERFSGIQDNTDMHDNIAWLLGL